MKKRRKSSAVYRHNRKVVFKKQLKRVGICFLSLVFFVAIIGFIYFCRRIDFFPITKVRLFVDQQYIDTTRLKQLVSRKLSGNFFTLSLTPIVRTLLTDDQIKTVSIQRVWPDSLSIYVDGYEPIAFFNKDKVITEEGYTFKTPQRLQLISAVSMQGPTSQASQMIQQLHLFNKTLQPLHLTVKKFVLDRDLYSITLNNDLHLTLGNHDLEQRLSRFVSLYASIIGRCGNNVTSIDLRYSNGLAVKWKDQGKCIGK